MFDFVVKTVEYIILGSVAGMSVMQLLHYIGV